MKEKIHELAKKIWPEVQAIRHHIHQNPELSFEEHETMAYVCEQLEAKGISYQRGVAGTGVVADIQGAGSGRVIALRSDLDALPIHEQSNAAYASSIDGVMHACGHDVHTASLLGAAFILHELREEFSGTVRCIFQPGEEKLPGGASLMIKEGILTNLPVELIIGQHVFPDLPAGNVGFRPGMYMASADEIYLTVKGKGGHGAMPHLNVDPVLIAAHLITSLQQVVSRKAAPIVPSVLSFGRVIADGASNVIPDQVELVGTFRTMDEDWRTRAHEEIKMMAEGICESMGGSCDVDIRVGYPFLKNDESLTVRNSSFAKDFLGEEQVHELPIRMTGEDFAFYSQQIPACFYRLGTSSADGKRFTSSVHTPTFDIDEEALNTGAGLMAYLAFENLKG